jgi:hypothetical protein
MSERLVFVLLDGLAVGAVITLLWFMLRRARSAARRSSGMVSAGWALLFLTSGRMPPPPPASQIEAELNGEKDRLGSRTIDPDEPDSTATQGEYEAKRKELKRSADKQQEKPHDPRYDEWIP